MSRKLIGFVCALFVGTLLFVSCSSDKGPAELAVKAAEEAVNAAKGEAAKYLPDEVKSMESALGALKDKLAKGDYKAVAGEAQGLVDKAKGLGEAVTAKKAELTKTWTDLEQGVPKMVAAVQSRVDILSKAKKLPANLTAEKFEEVKNGLTAAKEDWGKALENFKSGNMAEAVSLANAVKGKAVQAMQTLGLPTPAGA